MMHEVKVISREKLDALKEALIESIFESMKNMGEDVKKLSWFQEESAEAQKQAA